MPTGSASRSHCASTGNRSRSCCAAAIARRRSTSRSWWRPTAAPECATSRTSAPRWLGSLPRESAERERERLDARVKELDFEETIRDRARLPDELVEALLGDRAVALCIGV